MHNLDSYKECKGKLTPTIKINLNSVLPVHNMHGVKLLSRSGPNINHLN